MFKNLPRQTFGKVQSKLFPIYFGLSSACSAIQLGVLLFGAAGAPQKQLVLLGEASLNPVDPWGDSVHARLRRRSACAPALWRPNGSRSRCQAWLSWHAPPYAFCRARPRLLPALFSGGGASVHPHYVSVSLAGVPTHLTWEAACRLLLCLLPPSLHATPAHGTWQTARAFPRGAVTDLVSASTCHAVQAV